MPEPIPFRGQNAELGRGKNSPEVMSLPIRRQTHPDVGVMCVSCWRLTEPEIKEIVRTGVVWVGVAGVTQVPISVMALKPFDERLDD